MNRNMFAIMAVLLETLLFVRGSVIAAPTCGLLREETILAGMESMRPSSGATIELPSFDGAVVRISLGERRVSSTGVVSYGGKTAGAWLNDASVVMVPGGFVATVSSAEKASRLTFTVCGGKVAVRESAMSCGGRCGAPQHVHKTSRRVPGLAAAQVMQPLTGDPLVDGRDIMAAGETVTNVIDLLVGFDKSAAEWVRTRSAFAGLADATGLFAADAVQRCNAVFANTGLNELFTFNLAGVVEVGSDMSQAREPDGDVDAYAILNSVAGWSNELPAAYMADCKKVRDAREAACADIVTFLVACGNDNPYGYVGLAFSLTDSTIRQGRHRDYAYNVCIIEAVANGYMMSHEIGHLMGAGHAEMWRMNAETGSYELDDGEFGQSGPQLYDYSRGYYFCVTNDDVSIRGTTAMSYNFDGMQGAYNWGERWGRAPENALFPADWNSGLHTVTPFFSSSRHTYVYEGRDGDGNVVKVDSGVPLGDATHDNTRLLSKTFPLAANYRVRKNIVTIVDPAGGAKSLSGGGTYSADAVATLKAVAKTGFVFAGWYGGYDDASGEYSDPQGSADGADFRNPTVKFKTPSEIGKVDVYARFVTSAEDAANLSFNETMTNVMTVADGSLTHDLDKRVKSLSQPKLAVSGLPTGLKFDSKSMVISGQATKPGVYVVKVTATNASVKKGIEKTFEIKVPNLLPALFNDAGLRDSYLCWAGVAPESLSDVLSKVKADGWKLALSGLPSGLKYDDAKGTFTGVATKEGTSTVYFTATNGKKKQVATATFEVKFPEVTVEVAAWDGGSVSATQIGKVTGAGRYPLGKKVALKATPASGYVFVEWRGESPIDALAKRSPSVSFEMPAEDIALTAVFATTKQDADNVSLSVNGTDMSSSPGGSPATTNVICGVAVNWPLAVTALSATTVKVAGLPSGMKFTDKGVLKKGSKTEYDVIPNTIYGAPSAASKVDAKKGVVPSEVKVTVTTAGKTAVTYILKVVVSPLPAWAVGKFEGAAGNGVAAMSVTAAGKISGKLSLMGTNWTFKADSYASVESLGSATNFAVSAEATSGKATMPVGLSLSGAALGYLPGSAAACADGAFGGSAARLWRLVWADKGDAGAAGLVATYAGAYSFTAAYGAKTGDVAFTLDEKGVAKGSAVLPDGAKTRKATFSANALACEDGLHVVVAVAPDAKKGYPAVFEDRVLVAHCGERADGYAFRDPGVVLSVGAMTEGSGATGTVSANPKYGQVTAGKEVTLTAKAAKGSVFCRWEIDPAPSADGKDLSDPTLKLKMDGKGDVRAKAVFVTKEEDAENIELSVNGAVLSDSVTTNIYCGVAVDWPVAVTALSKTTVKVSGLPSGLKFTDKGVLKKGSKTEYDVLPNTIYGAPTAASKVDAKKGVVPSEVKVAVTTAGKTTKTYAFAVVVDPLPSWAVGTFDGAEFGCSGDAVDFENVSGLVQGLSVAANGKISGKALKSDGKWTLSADSFASYDTGSGMYLAAVVAKNGKAAATNILAVTSHEVDGVGQGVVTLINGGETVQMAWQNLWKTEPWKTTAKDFAKAPPLSVGEVSLKFAASGAVTAAGKFATGKDAKGKDVVYSDSCSSVLLPQGKNGYLVVLYFPPKKDAKGNETFAGYSALVPLFWNTEAKAFELVPEE